MTVRSVGLILVKIVVRVPPENAMSVGSVGGANQSHGQNKDQGANGARFALQEESDQVQHHEHDMIVQQGRGHGLRDQQDRD